MGLSTEAYRPGANSLRVDATASSVSGSLPSGGGTIEVTNTSATLFIVCTVGVGATTAVLMTSPNIGPGWCVPPLATKRFRINPNADTFAAIGSGAGPTSVFVSRGDGGT